MRHILLIEDNPDDVLITQRILAKDREKFELDVASTGKEGLEKLTQREFECLLLDHNLPDTNALELLKKVRQSYSHLPAIILTGLRDERLLGGALKLGAVDFLTKDEAAKGETLPRRILAAILTGRRNRFLEGGAKRVHLYEKMIETMGEGLFALDVTQTVVFTNQRLAEILDCQETDLLGQSIFDLLGEEAAKTFKHQYPQIKKGKGVSFEATLIPKIKEKVPVLINQTSLFDGEGNFNGSLCLVVDLTELKRTQEKLRKAEKLSTIAQVAQEAAHEIKNPLSVLGVGLYYLRKMLPEDEKIKKKINQMDKAVERASSYLNDLSSLSRPPIVELSPIDINDFIEQVLGDISLDLLTGIELRKDLAKDLPKIQVDPDRLRQVFTNLIKNACEAMPCGGALTISSCIDGSQIVITFSDTGPGIKEEDLGKLFDPFFTTKSKGTGLGLVIVKRIIEAHQGRIGLESKVGKGTRFTIKLPIG